jgi:phosphonate metabolism protein PhnN/1,5-bisphosphokinase (PRPP-forming)
VSEDTFLQRSFALHWQAHGLHYGIPLDVIDDLRRGTVAVANVSRGVIAQAAAKFPVRVIEVTAPPEILARRLAERGRETADDIARRLARGVPIPDYVAVDTIMNDKAPVAAVDRFVAVLIRAASAAPPG